MQARSFAGFGGGDETATGEGCQHLWVCWAIFKGFKTKSY